MEKVKHKIRKYYEEHFMRNKLMDEMERILQNESLND